MNSEIRRVMSTASNSSLKQSCSALTSVTSALQVISSVMLSINPRFTYLLTYLLFVIQRQQINKAKQTNKQTQDAELQIAQFTSG